MTGDNYWIFIGPIVFFFALIGWVCLMLVAGRRERRYRHRRVGKRGPVAGGVIEGSPAQVNSGHVSAPADVDEPGDRES